MSSPFRDLIRESDGWFEYCRLAWQHSGKPAQLEPSKLHIDPIVYGEEIYSWLEAKYQGEFEDTFERVDSTLTTIDVINEEFLSIWERYFDPWSLWKQLIPMFVFSSALGELTSNHSGLAAAYIIGQGVPSGAVDKVLDTYDYRLSRQHLERLTPFCLVSYSTGLELVRSLHVASRVEDIFLHYTRLMYAHMWKESAERYVYPRQVLNTHLEEHVNGESRLLSSVFYSVAIEWAFALTDSSLSMAGRRACVSFRRVRQLNDEIIDAEEDFKNGILTYPILHSLASRQHGHKMYRLLAKAWPKARDTGEVPDSMVQEFRSIVMDANSFLATARESLDKLSEVMRFLMTFFDAEDAFDLSLMVNHRLSMLLKRARNDWRDVPEQYVARLVRPHPGRRS